jgi:KaiC/GvpD/RAD55 family RecA-like ATPase
LIQEILNKNKDIFSVDFIQNGLIGLIEKHPVLKKLSIDSEFQLHSELPDFSGTIDALREFTEFLYNYIMKLITQSDVNSRFIQVGEEFIKENSTSILKSDLLANLPTIFFNDKNTVEKLDISALKKEPPINQLIIIYESIFTVYLQESLKTDDRNLFFSSVADLKKSFPILNQFLITKTGDVTIMPKEENTAEDLEKELADVFNYFVEFSSYHLDEDMALKRAREIIGPILNLLEDLPEKLGIMTYILKGALKNRIPTGIIGFDSMIQGGIPRNKSILIQAPQGSEKNFFISHFIKTCFENNSYIMVVLGQVSPKIFKVQLKTLGVDFTSNDNKDSVKIVDWYSWLTGNDAIDSNEEGIVLAKGDLPELWRTLENTLSGLKQIPVKCAVLNFLTSALNKFSLDQVQNFLKGIIQKFKENDVTALFLIEKDSHDNKTIAKLRTLFDGVIDIENEEVNGKTNSKIRILFMNGTVFETGFKLLTLNGTKLNVSQTEYI